ncbi:hypothetical protein [Nocardioides sp. 503]|uniref:hypothetical protein n=1 Tax=Nocardioides sp. 503 TaxID=2508326 RepID=UPI00106FEE9B|nr:hypothetical protein [Nocardioides sp. 503]
MKTIKPWGGRGTTRAGEFKGYCRLVEKRLLTELRSNGLREGQVAREGSHWDAKLGGEAAHVQCNLELPDATLFDAHMDQVHDQATERTRAQAAS